MNQSYLDDFFKFLSFPSVSTDSQRKESVQECCSWLSEYLQKLNFQSEIHQTPGHPVILAKSPDFDPQKKTILIYGHYDVQPETPTELWNSDPFQPEIRDGKIFARGATDNKGQLFGHVLGIKEYLEKNKELPLNITLLFEGEEEIGSPNLRKFLEDKKAELQADICIVSDTGMVAPNTPTFTYGLRGIACMEVTVHGPKQDLHSGVYGGIIANPAIAATQLISSCIHEDGSVLIKDFYKGVTPLENWEKEHWEKDLAFLGDSYKEVTGVSDFSKREHKGTLERVWAQPTFEINGLYSGYQGEGSKTIIPSQAHFKISMRLTPGQNSEEIISNTREHLEKNCPQGITLDFSDGHCGSAYHCDPHSMYGKAAQEALEDTFQKKPVLIREGGSVPIIQDIKEVLKLETLLIGFALPDCNMHSPDENFTVDNFERVIEVNQKLISKISKL